MKKQILSLALAALLLAAAVSGCSKNNSSDSSGASGQTSSQDNISSSADTQKHIIFTQNGMKFYSPQNALIQITGSSTFHLLDQKNMENTQPIVVSPDLCGLTVDEAILYGTQKSETGIFSWNIRDISFPERTTLFNKADFVKAANDTDAVWFDRLKQSADGGDGFIYCILSYDDQKNATLDGRLMRYSKDGKTLELIGEEKLSTVAVQDDVIYYAADDDNGGIYKMNKDGSGKEAVAGTEGFMDISELNIVDGSLYFIAETDGKTGKRLYSLKLSESSAAGMSDETCIMYYVDEKDNMVYYLGGNNEVPAVYSRTLSDGAEKPMFETKLCTENIDPETERMTTDDGYLYFSSSGFELPVFIESEEASGDTSGIVKYKTVSGMRYDLSEGAMDYIYCYYLGSTDKATGERLTAGPVMIEYRSSKGTVTDSKSGLYIF